MDAKIPSQEGSKQLLECRTQHNAALPLSALSFSKVWPPGLEVIKLDFILRIKIKRNDWLLADTCPQAANHCTLF